MPLPLVSIIIPFYNAEDYLRESIAAAMEQTWPSKEIIMVDDGSTDGSLAIAQSYATDTGDVAQRVKVLTQKNKGAAAARNYGLREAKGAYIQFLDGDDLLSADKISNQMDLLLLQPNKVAVCSTVHFNNGTDPSHAQPSPHEDSFLIATDPVHFLINLWGGYSDNGSMVTIHAWLCPRQLIDAAGPWNESLTVDDDGEYFCRVLLQAQGVLKSGGYSYYRKHTHARNLSAGKTRTNFLSQLQAMTLRFNHIAERGQSIELEQAYLRSLHHFRVSVYPQFPDLMELAEQQIRRLNKDFKFNYRFPSKMGNLLSSLLGWQLTKRLQLAWHSLIK